MHVDARFGFESSVYSFNEGPSIKSVAVVLLEHELTSPVSVQFTVADLSASEFALIYVAIIYATRSGARFARPLLVYEFRDCCFDWLEDRDRL